MLQASEDPPDEMCLHYVYSKVVHQPLNNQTTVMSGVNDFRSSVEEAAAGYCSLLPCSEEVIVREPLHFSLGSICVI